MDWLPEIGFSTVLIGVSVRILWRMYRKRNPPRSNEQIGDDVKGPSRAEIEAVAKLSSVLVRPGGTAIGELIGDVARSWRMHNLMRVSEKFDAKCKERGFDPVQGRKIAWSIGLPLIEKASYQDDDLLQDRWANLLVSSTTETDRDQEDAFDLSVRFIEILSQFSRLDCHVLEYVVEHSVKEWRPKRMIANPPIRLATIAAAFPEHQVVHLSVEKLTHLGCIDRVLLTPLSAKGEDESGAHPLADGYLSTVTGINLYVASSGKQPQWAG